ncbi:MAG: hypothetical protein HGB26_07020, partial [Desulfobulbaceae bacterium]|nr:hypothetical protein [Desulfobulbaceae bacterium]
NSITGTSKENFLQIIENCFKTGEIVFWCGVISFFSQSEEATLIAKYLTLGLKWITALGGSKGSGFGRLESVTTELHKTDFSLQQKNDISGLSDGISLHLEFIDDLLIGGITRGTNFIESETVIPGGVIKGSLGRFLNQLCDTVPDTKAISLGNSNVASRFPVLAKYFSVLQFSHAFPVYTAQELRPVIIPFSAVQTSSGEGLDAYYDVALLEKPSLDINNKAPEFQVNWKNTGNLLGYFGWASCEIINKTRTAIDPKTRRAKDESLYTFQYLTPLKAGSENEKIKWIANLRFPSLEPPEQEELSAEFIKAIHQGWNVLGKRDSRFRFTVYGRLAQDTLLPQSEAVFDEDIAVVVLQTDALMFDGKAIAANHQKPDLQSIYNDYWEKITEHSCELSRFFARQKFSGGYLAKRYKLYHHYYPFILTEAGSVFVLKINNKEKAEQILQRFQKQGLPLPATITQRVPENREHWELCPFVPENGYGEIRINQHWHWSRLMQVNHEGAHL